MIKYKVVRSYSEYRGDEELKSALKDGWKPVWGSEFIPVTKVGCPGYIEYILKKEVEEGE